MCFLLNIKYKAGFNWKSDVQNYGIVLSQKDPLKEERSIILNEKRKQAAQVTIWLIVTLWYISQSTISHRSSNQRYISGRSRSSNNITICREQVWINNIHLLTVTPSINKSPSKWRFTSNLLGFLPQNSFTRLSTSVLHDWIGLHEHSLFFACP